MLVWSRGDILLAGAEAAGPLAPNPVGTTGLAGRVFYFLDDEEDLAKHVGQEIEVKGDLEDFEKGEIEIKHYDLDAYRMRSNQTPTLKHDDTQLSDLSAAVGRTV